MVSLCFTFQIVEMLQSKQKENKGQKITVAPIQNQSEGKAPDIKNMTTQTIPQMGLQFNNLTL